MRRLILIGVVLLGASAFAVVASGAGGDSSKPKFWVEFDNAFGLIEGADLKVTGVRAGKISDMKVDPRTHRALIGVQVTENGFGSFRKDARCDSKPQSLIGEYFVDCSPGHSPVELKDGARIPVSHTTSTIPPDLVNNILRLPYKQRLRIIINELGAGVAARGGDLNEAIRRADPALRETQRVLRILARQNRVLRDLAEHGDKVITALADRRKDVSRWVVEARDTAQASAERREDIAAGFRKLPGFLEQLRPTMAALGQVASQQTPALQNLNASSGQLTRFFNNLGPFSEASRPAFRSLGNASLIGRQAVRAARPSIAELRHFSAHAPELSKNLRIVLNHLDDRQFAAESDPASPGGKGYTGLEAILTYVFDQVMAINVFDQDSYKLKVNLFYSQNCSPYADAERARQFSDQCSSTAPVAPHSPGVFDPDPSAPSGSPKAAKRRSAKGAKGAAKEASQVGSDVTKRPAIDLDRTIGSLLGRLGSQLSLPPTGGNPLPSGNATDLLDYLLAP